MRAGEYILVNRQRAFINSICLREGQLSLTSAADKHRSNDEGDDNRLGVLV